MSLQATMQNAKCKMQIESSAMQEARRRSRELAAKRVAGQAYLWLLLIVLYAPIFLIFIFSFTQSKIIGNWTGFTFHLYENLFTGYDATRTYALIRTCTVLSLSRQSSPLLRLP